jgi:hypothetical protein
MSKKYKLEVSFVQSTGGSPDGVTTIEDSSDDPVVHLIKTKVFAKHLTAAAAAITEELCNMGLAQLSSK